MSYIVKIHYLLTCIRHMVHLTRRLRAHLTLRLLVCLTLRLLPAHLSLRLLAHLTLRLLACLTLRLHRPVAYLTQMGGGPRVVVSTAAFHARVRGSVPGLGGLKETQNVSSPSTCETQYCGEPL